jgi:CMP-N,N'-diacetyllegionaminic acid synthase
MASRIGLIPARKGSQRLPGKNIMQVNGHPLIAYTISTAQKCGIFDRIVVSTDCAETAEIAIKYGAEVPELRSPDISAAESPDIDWVLLAINEWLKLQDNDYICILRPTSPLRTPASIIKAFELLINNSNYDSIRAIRPIREHPSKMWRGKPGASITPFDDSVVFKTNTPAHSSPFQVLEKLWIQDASLEIVRVGAVRKNSTISGQHVMGFEMPNHEGFDINYPEDMDFVRKVINDLGRTI